MKKELEGKKYYQAANRPGKTSGNTATPKGLKEIPKARMSVHPPTPKTTAPKTTRTMSKQTFSSKYAESKSPLVIVKEISKQSITEEKIPKRMLTVGEK